MKGEIAVMGVDGDTKVIWDSDNEDEVKNAKRTFKELIKKGFLAFTVGKKGKQDEQIDEFDKELEKIILVPAMEGG